MRSRWSTVLAVLGLTVIALGSGRAAHAVSVAGLGTVFSPGLGVNLGFAVLVESQRGGFVRVASGRDHVHCEGRIVAIGPSQVDISAVVTHSTHPLFPPGTPVNFFFRDSATGDIFGSGAFGVPLFTPIASGDIRFRP
jgi:hypothetical protein